MYAVVGVTTARQAVQFLRVYGFYPIRACDFLPQTLFAVGCKKLGVKFSSERVAQGKAGKSHRPLTLEAVRECDSMGIEPGFNKVSNSLLICFLS